MRFLILFISGIFVGFWLSWPGIFMVENWKCFNEIISKSKDNKFSVKAALSVSPNYFLKGNKKDFASKIRIVSDACFR